MSRCESRSTDDGMSVPAVSARLGQAPGAVIADLRSWAFPHEYSPNVEPLGPFHCRGRKAFGQHPSPPHPPAVSPLNRVLWYRSNGVRSALHAQPIPQPMLPASPHSGGPALHSRPAFLSCSQGLRIPHPLLLVTENLGPIYCGREVRGLVSAVSLESIFVRIARDIFSYSPGILALLSLSEAKSLRNGWSKPKE